MKSSHIKQIFSFSVVILFLACSVKKDKFINRNFHAVTAEYNILYNGNLALDAGLTDLVATYSDNFWEILPVERMPEVEDNFLPGQTKNPNFERAEEKAVKAIQKHSMNIKGIERNPQMDEAYLLLGKARYYDNRFLPALEALNYILYKYPNSDQIYHAKVWREKVNIRLDNNEGAIDNLKNLLERNKLDGQDLADANAMLSQAFLNISMIDSAVPTIKIAKQETRKKEEKARYTFILGQLYEKLNYPDSAYAAFQEVIDMNRKSPRRYVIQAHAHQAAQFDYEKGDSIVFLEKFADLLKDRENRPYKDILYHQLGIFYDKYKVHAKAEDYYNKSLVSRTKDQYLVASNYRNIGEMYFKRTDYKIAGHYYDSALVRMDVRTREYRRLNKKRASLNEAILYEDIAHVNDSVLSVVNMNGSEQIAYYEKHIQKLKETDSIRVQKEKELAEKEALIQSNLAASKPTSPKFNPNPNAMPMNPMMPPIGSDADKFYFYNINTVTFGISEFKRKWGNRKLVENWRQSTTDNAFVANQTEDEFVQLESKDSIKENPLYSVKHYISQLPTEQHAIDSIKQERDKAYYQLGLIYKEKFKEYQLAANRLEHLLELHPDESLVLPTKYNLFKIYQIIDPSKAASISNDIVNNYPDSRYAQIIQNPTQATEDNLSPEKIYTQMFKQLEQGNVREVYAQINTRIEEFEGEEVQPKFEILKALTLARVEGLEAYKSALSFTAINYPNQPEGKQAQHLLEQDIPKLEAINFSENENTSTSWKIIFPKKYSEGVAYNELLEKINKFITEGYKTEYKTSVDVYDLNTDFVVLHGIMYKESATSILRILRDAKTYNIKEEAYIISSDDYKVIQVKKMFNPWLAKNNN